MPTIIGTKTTELPDRQTDGYPPRNKQELFNDRKFQELFLQKIKTNVPELSQSMIAGGVVRDSIVGKKSADFGDLDVFATNALQPVQGTTNHITLMKLTCNAMVDALKERFQLSAVNFGTIYEDSKGSTAAAVARHLQTSQRVKVQLPSFVFELNLIIIKENTPVLEYLNTFNTNISKCAFYLDNNDKIKTYVTPEARRDISSKTITYIIFDSKQDYSHHVKYINKILSKRHFSDYNITIPVKILNSTDWTF